MSSMESLVVDQSFSLGKPMKKTCQNVNNNPHYLHQIPRMSTNIPRQSDNVTQNYAKPPQLMHDYDTMMMMLMHHGGLYLNNNQHHAPAPPYHHHHQHHNHLTNSFPPIKSFGHEQHQPPLLPFPPAASRLAFHSKPPLRRSQSLSPSVVVPRGRTPVKNKKENKKGIDNNGVNNTNSVKLSSDKVGKSSKARKRSEVSIGPTKENNGRNDVTRMMSDVIVEMDGCPISPVFRMAPPPSSLPLPRFTLRKPPPPPSMKLRCNAETAAVDGAATDNICMLLRLR